MAGWFGMVAREAGIVYFDVIVGGALWCFWRACQAGR